MSQMWRSDQLGDSLVLTGKPEMLSGNGGGQSFLSLCQEGTGICAD